jgi:hypothetical protein
MMGFLEETGRLIWFWMSMSSLGALSMGHDGSLQDRGIGGLLRKRKKGYQSE